MGSGASLNPVYETAIKEAQEMPCFGVLYIVLGLLALGISSLEGDKVLRLSAFFIRMLGEKAARRIWRLLGVSLIFLGVVVLILPSLGDINRRMGC
jgi:small neutral amino acid transporter SnatA (MarC family)